MSRNGSGVYSAPAGTTATAGTTIESAKYNAFVADLVNDANLARPIVAGGTGSTTASGARTALGLAIGTNVQAYDAGLQSIAGLTTAADKMIYTTGADTYAVADLTAAGRAILDDVDAAAQRVTLGAQPLDADLTAISALTGTGLLARTGAGTYAERTITSTDLSVTITNPGGVGGNIDLSAAPAAPTTAQVLAATAGLTVGDIGTYGFLRINTLTTLGAGGTIAGSGLRYSNAGGASSGATPSGTWRACGALTNVSNPESTSLMVRIS